MMRRIIILISLLMHFIGVAQFDFDSLNSIERIAVERDSIQNLLGNITASETFQDCNLIVLGEIHEEPYNDIIQAKLFELLNSEFNYNTVLLELPRSAN